MQNLIILIRNKTLQMLQALFVCSILLFNTANSFAQSKVICGKVIDEDLAPVVGAYIFINDTIKKSTTDINGLFHAEIPEHIQYIKIGCVGYQFETIELKPECDYIEIILMYRSTNCFPSQKQILRGIKRNYKKIPIIRNNAIKKGIFKVTRPDYKLI